MYHQSRNRLTTDVNSHKSLVLVVVLALAALLSACTQTTRGATSTTPGTRVFFVEPGDHATVASPVKVRMGAENFTVEPAGAVSAGHGHLHIMVDANCIAAGQAVPKDETHLHYGKGQTEATLTLTPGQHTLCLQAANGSHIALDGAGMTQKITVVVK